MKTIGIAHPGTLVGSRVSRAGALLLAASLGVTMTACNMTLGFGTTLIGEAVDYAIYYLIQSRGAGAGHWRRESWPTVRLGLFTSLIGFAALVFTGFPGLAQLGVFSIAGLAAAAATTRFVFPVLVPGGAPGSGFRRQLARFMTTRFSRECARRSGSASSTFRCTASSTSPSRSSWR